MKSAVIAFAMYSKIPMPRVEWDKKSLAWALCWFPVVGAVIGAALWGWLWLWDRFDLGTLGAAGGALLPIALSGGIHMDGLCDTCDALASNQDRARRLEILKDSHAGAFACIGCGVYLLALFAAWTEAPRCVALALSPVLSRCLSGLAAVSWKNARGSGLLASFTAPMDAGRAKAVLLGLTVLVMVGMTLLDGYAAVLAAALSFLWYRRMAFRAFGGITGDTAGWFLQICELFQVAGMAVAGKAGF